MNLGAPAGSEPYVSKLRSEQGDEVWAGDVDVDHNASNANPEPRLVKEEPREVEFLEDPPPNRPQRRQRLILEVVVYSWAALQKRRQKDFEKIKKLNNPKIKKTKNVEFSISSIYDRLKADGLNPFKVKLEQDIRDQPVSRAFMASVYGGSSQDTFPVIGPAKLAVHGMRDFMYVNASVHTNAPQWPGNPGDYMLSYSPSLSKEEWILMADKVRNAWISLIKKKGWAHGFRTRVVARQELGRKPTESECETVSDEGRSNDVTLEDIRNVLDSGHEQLGVSVMKCVGYDEAFQRQVVERFRNWVPPSPKPKPRGERKTRGRKASKSESESKRDIKQEIKTMSESKASGLSRKRKREETPEPDQLFPESEDEAEVVDISDIEEGDLKPVRKAAPQVPVRSSNRRKGTQVDPIIL